ncbi:putative calmodulin-lysine N-methyltransferase-like [Penaeus vannamei]|uniref:Putative calmodulin-lysine N-methyltransferase-like n=1 Tax=Penaeus vannamei TaxID=6689 RepID=A0A423TW39_PENVA|nr:putative calmodulin-lysine N-methyltransferase-like [Penaeus vannamei]
MQRFSWRSQCGFQVAASGVAAKIVLTDGNAISVNNVQVSLERNDLPTETTASLFFDEGRESLLYSLLAVLRPGGTALVVAPARSGTFQLFASMCRPHFRVVVVEKYDGIVDDHVRKCAQDPHYNDNLHFPLLMILKKLGNS